MNAERRGLLEDWVTGMLFGLLVLLLGGPTWAFGMTFAIVFFQFRFSR